MLLLSCTLRHVRYTKMTKQSIRHSDRKDPFIQSEPDVLIETRKCATHKKNKIKQQHAYTHTAISAFDGNGTSELNIGVFAACLEM